MDTTHRYAYIDAVRGVAALSVVYFHSALMFLGRGIPLANGEWTILYGLTNIFDLGKIAVIAFFAISGYVIPFSLLRTEPGTKTGFIIGRVFRLYPAYWLSMLGALVFLFQMAGQPIAAKTVFANATMLQKYVGQPDMIGVYWTLQIEIMFYILCFGMNLFGWLAKPRIVFATTVGFILIAIAMAAARYATGRAIPVAIPLSLMVMFFGMLWRTWHMHHAAEIKVYIRWLLILMAVAIPPISILAYSVDQGHNETWYRYVITYYTAVPLFCIFTSKLRSSSKMLAYLGAISYSVYLFGAIVEAIAEMALPELLNGHYPAHLFIAIVMLGTVLVSIVVYNFVEKPSIRLGKWLSRKITHRAQPASVTAFEAPL